MPTENTVETDVLVIGGGISGLLNQQLSLWYLTVTLTGTELQLRPLRRN